MLFSRRKATPSNKSVDLQLDVGNAEESKNKRPKGCFVDMMEWIVLFVIFFGGFYYYTFTDKEKAFHKQQMDLQLKELTKQFEEQKTSLNTQLEGLYKQLFEAQQQEQVGQANAVSDAEAPPGAQAAETNEAAQGQAEQLKTQIDQKKAELDDRQKKLAGFCEDCPFNQGGLSTTCGLRRNYILSKYGLDREPATLAVIDLMPSCLSSN